MADEELLGELFRLSDNSTKKPTTKRKKTNKPKSRQKKTNKPRTRQKKLQTKEDIMNSGLNTTFDGLKKLSLREKMEIIGYAAKYFE